MRSATIDGSTQELLTAARPGDLLIQIGEPARVGVVVKACSEAPRFHVAPCDSKAPEVWADSLRLIKLEA
mgnify:CR=1 FL=1